MSTPAKVLIVEDEKPIRRFLRLAIEEEGCQVAEAGTIAQGLLEAGARQPDLLVLDLGLPDGNGIRLIQDLRGWSDTPILILSARADERDKIDALDAGADDYLTKPFGMDELLARIRVALRHALRHGDSDSPVFEVGDLHVDLGSRQIKAQQRDVHLTPTEFRLLATLIRHAGKVVTHRQLLNEVWGPDSLDETHSLRVYMAKLRDKIEEALIRRLLG